MSRSAALAAIKARAASFSAATLKVQGDDTFVLPEPPAAFAALEIAWTDGEGMSIGAPGANLVRRYGLIWAHGFCPKSTAAHDEVADDLSAQLGALFENADFSGVVCQAASPGGDGPASTVPGQEQALYWRSSASIEFTFDETA